MQLHLEAKAFPGVRDQTELKEEQILDTGGGSTLCSRLVFCRLKAQTVKEMDSMSPIPPAEDKIFK